MRILLIVVLLLTACAGTGDESNESTTVSTAGDCSNNVFNFDFEDIVANEGISIEAVACPEQQEECKSCFNSCEAGSPVDNVTDEECFAIQEQCASDVDCQILTERRYTLK